MSNGQTVRVVVDGMEVLATLNVEQSRQFRRDGFDVHSNVTISFTQVTMYSMVSINYYHTCKFQAILGGTIRIDGLTSPFDLKVLIDSC